VANSLDPTLPERAHAAIPATGLLLINLGTPDAPTPPAIRRYLAEFLRDERVVDLSRLIWLPVLYGFILPFRPKRLAHAYGSIWTEQGSPLLAISRSIGAALGPQLSANAQTPVHVAIGMRYGNPSVASALDELVAKNVRRIVVLPLYPQYSASATASAFDAVWKWLAQQRWVPELRTITSYHDHPGYIEALANSVRAHWAKQGRTAHLLISFHGIPQRYVLSGDPYYCQCQKTGRLLAEALQLAPDDYSIAFQSRLGKEPWLFPYTDLHLPELAKRGIRRVDTICPGFSADCLETLEEVAIRYRELFATLGGELHYIPALNDSAEHIAAIAGIASAALQGLSPAPLPAGESLNETLTLRAERAKKARITFDG